MKKGNLIIMGTLAMALAFGLVLAGCEDDSDEGGGGPTTPSLSDFKGTYSGSFTPTASSLTVTEDSLKVGTTEITGVTTSTGGSVTGGDSWVYLNAGGKKIGIALSASSVKQVYLGESAVNTAKSSLSAIGVNPSGIENGTITGTGQKAG
jgi:hypothetical protein